MNDERYRGSYLPVYFGGTVPVTICNDCGSLVLDTDTHEEFHQRFDDTSSRATRATMVIRG